MPTYQYECQTCQQNYEVKQRFSDDPLDTCITPTCDGTPQRIISAVGIVFKGSGFYINDSKNKSSSSTVGSSTTKTDDKADTSGDKSTEKSSDKSTAKSSTPATASAD